MQKMLRSLLGGTVAALTLAACGGAPADNTPAASAEATAASAASAPVVASEVVIGLDDNFPPMGFRDDNNEIVGFDIDMAREAAQRAGLTATFQPIDWSAKEAELKSGRVDMLWNGLTITEERKQNILFSNPYMENHQIIVVRADSPIKVKADLAGKVVAVQDGSSAVDAVNADDVSKSFKELKKFGDNVMALMDLGAKRADAVVVDEVVGRYYVAKKPAEYTVLADNFGTEEYGVGFRLEDAALQQKIQKSLDDMKADGASAKISDKWFGKNIVK
ncbi:amino acid ABC transporter substrate-binding protein [Stenoxybacter acetivorans]|uniref:amino acid ABC transporter substrate-binding protein n=1 Tax=Stenoxybacter acetivorans TaxID=422441 RepID=UPI00069041B0|nr:amino acid ABC transporter substrate-binding protein [Stenoxybacter acetivorans]